jgi:hypothetical protein
VTNLEQRACFPDEDGKLILRIPVCHQQEDFIVCHFDSKVHWVSFLRGASSVQGEGSHSVLDNLSVWSNLWRIKCLAKVHHIVWIFCLNSHPMHMNAKLKGIYLDTQFVVCH